MLKKKMKTGDIVFNICNYTIMFLLLFICVYPFYYIFIYSISDPELAAKGLTFYPKGLTLDNLNEVMKLKGIFPAFGVSVARTVIGTALNVMTSMFLGYLFTKPMYLRKFFYRMVVVTMYVGGGVIPTYLIFRFYGLTNSFWVYIIPTAVTAYNIILCKTFIENLPESLEESARLDGAGYVTVFIKIVLPLSKAIMASITVFGAVSQWNSWTDNYIYNTDERLNTLQLILYNFLKEATILAQILEESTNANVVTGFQLTPMSIRMTVTMLVMIPILCIYPFMQKYFVKGVMIGAVKG